MLRRKTYHSDESDEDMKIEILNYDGLRHKKHTYSISKNYFSSNEKRLICYSIINNNQCQFGKNCTYAHNYDDQIIDNDRMAVYRIILDSTMKDLNIINEPKKNLFYKQLLFCTNQCELCSENKCPGGYNCRNGVNLEDLKVCKNDFLTGECMNRKININISDKIKNKITDIVLPNCYEGCINGHHLSSRGLNPYYKFLHMKQHNKYDEKYIDIDHILKMNHIYAERTYFTNDTITDSSSDEEINSWFKKI